MENLVARTAHRSFHKAIKLFEPVDASTMAALASVAADITLLVDAGGQVLDVAYRDPSLDVYGLEDFRGKAFRDTVTPECYDKIDALVEENAKTGTTRRRQVNHGAAGQPDLPVDYTLISVPGFSAKLAIGEDLRRFSGIQQQLVRAQAELETEYRKIREAESRYRTIFHKTAQAILVIDGDNHEIIDVNMTGANLLQQPAARLVGRNAVQLAERDNRPAFIDALGAARHGGIRRNLDLSLPGHDKPLFAVIEPYRENGRGNLMVTLLPGDGPAQAASGRHGDGSLLDSFPEALVVIDRKGVIIEANDQFLDLLHILNKSMIAERNLNSWLGASSVDLQVLLSRVREEGHVRQFATVVRDELGMTKGVTVSAARVPGNEDGQRIGIFIAEAGRRDTTINVPTPGGRGEQGDFAELVGRVPLKDLIREAVDVIEKMCIEAALRQTDNNRASAADMLGLSRQSLYIKLRRHNLEDFTTDSK